jgi:hypothetical protein
MFLDADLAPKSLINLKKYAQIMGVSRQAVHYQLQKGICSVQPILASKPPKWDLADVVAYRRTMESCDDEN